MKRYIYHASWRATAIRIAVTAKDEDEAFIKAAKRIKKMEGGDSCLELKLVKTE